MFFAIITELAAKSDLRRVPHALVWSDYYRFPINMVFAAYLLETAILVLSDWAICTLFLIPTVGFWYERPAPPWREFVAFPKQNDKCPTNTQRGMCTLGMDWAILLCPAFVRSSRVKQIRRSNSDRAAGFEKTTGGPNSRCEGRVLCNLHNIGDAPVLRYRRPLKI